MTTMDSTTGQSEQSTTEQAKEKVQETAQQVQEKAQEVRGQAATRLREQVDSRSTQVGSQMQSTADAMRRTGEQLRNEGQEGPAKVTEAVAQRAERLGNYLTDVDAGRMLQDVEDFARRQPWLVAGGGLVLGLLSSRLLKASSSRRYEERDGQGFADWSRRQTGAPYAASSSSYSSPALGATGGMGDVAATPTWQPAETAERLQTPPSGESGGQ